jgi:transcriptional regulator with XRE-family HTH domain
MPQITDVEQIPPILTRARETRGLSRRELAALADTSHQTIHSYETGKGSRLDLLIRITRALGLKVKIDRG